MAQYAYVRPYSPAPAGGPTVVWTIGDSITRGAEPVGPPSSWSYIYRGGWRSYAFAAMTAAGQAPNFIGGLSNASETPAVTNAGTGHNGNNNTSSNSWLNTNFAAYQPGLSATPHIITIATGANDEDSDNAALEFASLVDLAATTYPRAVILAATRTQQRPTVGATHRTKVLSEMAIRRARGMHVTVVDQWPEVDVRNMPDGVHLDPVGYRILGDLWGRYLTALANGLAGA